MLTSGSHPQASGAVTTSIGFRSTQIRYGVYGYMCYRYTLAFSQHRPETERALLGRGRTNLHPNAGGVEGHQTLCVGEGARSRLGAPPNQKRTAHQTPTALGLSEKPSRGPWALRPPSWAAVPRSPCRCSRRRECGRRHRSQRLKEVIPTPLKTH